MLKPRARIADIRLTPTLPGGPWTTKSSARLDVAYYLSSQASADFFQIDPDEMAINPHLGPADRCYIITDLKHDAIGGGEFHRGRRELITVVLGIVEWIFEDVYGQKRTITVQQGQTIQIEPYILHSYKILSDTAILCIRANTSFDPNGGEQGADTYGQKEFSVIQKQHQLS